MAALAKGAKSGKSKRSALLQPFQPLLVSWVGRSDLVVLTHVEADGSRLEMVPKCLYSGFYLNELIVRSTPRGDQVTELFHVYRATIERLSVDPVVLEPTLRIFEKRLLAILGYGLVLACDVNGETIMPDSKYRYDLASGPVLVSDENPFEINVSGTTLLALDREQLAESQHLTEAKRLLQAALRPVIGPAPLKSREMYRQALAFNNSH